VTADWFILSARKANKLLRELLFGARRLLTERRVFYPEAPRLEDETVKDGFSRD